MIRVLIVDDSAFARKVLRESLTEAHGFTVVGYARDGLEALELVSRDPPDVVTLDLVMPNLDGLGFMRALATLPMPPRVVVVSMNDGDSALGIEALQAGAFDLVHKPTALPTQRLYELADELRQKVRAAAAGRPPVVQVPRPEPRSSPALGHPLLATRRSVVVIGTSTGGPAALTRVLSDLPGNFPVPVVMVLHISLGYTRTLAERLDKVSALQVVEASDGLLVSVGVAALAPAGVHLRLKREGAAFRVSLGAEPVDAVHRPSVDVLFESVASEGAKALGVILTGMGDDGLAGAKRIVAEGGTVLTEAESTCVVYGMPRVVAENRLSAATAPITDMASLIVRNL